MELKIIKKGYYVNISHHEITELTLNQNKNPKKQLCIVINFVINLVKTLGINNIGKRMKINITKENDCYRIIIFPLYEYYTPFAMKINNEKELLTLIKQLHKSKCSKLCISSVYVLNNKYYLLITPITKNKWLKLTCTEFCLDIITNVKDILKIQYNGKEICSVNAIDKLGEAI